MISLKWLFCAGVLAVAIACTTKTATTDTAEPGRDIASAEGGALNYVTAVDLSSGRGGTFLNLMRAKIKPLLDQYSVNGFPVANGRVIQVALRNVDGKVANGAVKSAGGEPALVKLADQLSASEAKSTLYTLPDAVARAGAGRERYTLSTFLALASGGGVAVKIDPRNYYYNVNYGSGAKPKDEMTGRSFGEAPGHKASDASDKFYLLELNRYIQTEGAQSANFYRALMLILTACDVSGYPRVSPLGQTVGTDFLAIYTAEQDRHLMANFRAHPWDEALLEVTLLSSFHAGQQKLMVMFNGALAETTLKQAPGGEPRTVKQPATLADYWQFSSNPDPKSKNRSGINVTRKQFRALGQLISDYERKNNPSVVTNVERHFRNVRTGGNVYAELSAFLISPTAPPSLGGEAIALAEDMTAFLEQVRKDANAITTAALRGVPMVATPESIQLDAFPDARELMPDEIPDAMN